MQHVTPCRLFRGINNRASGVSHDHTLIRGIKKIRLQLDFSESGWMCAYKKGKQMKLGEGEVHWKKSDGKRPKRIILFGVKGSLDLVVTVVAEKCIYYAGIERMSDYA